MSPERQAAQLKVEDALHDLRSLVEDETGSPRPEHEVLTGWAAVTSFTSYEDGEPATGLSLFMPDTMPDWQTVGLLRSAQVMAESNYRDDPGARS